MTPEYIHLDSRHWVNEAFVMAVRELYPSTTKKIPLGYQTYTGWSGKDLIIFIQHDPLEDLAKFSGPVYEVAFDLVSRDIFEGKMLAHIRHRTPERTPRDNPQGPLIKMLPNKKIMVSRHIEGSRYPKRLQTPCLAASKKLSGLALKLIKPLVVKHPKVLNFLAIHGRRGGDVAAKVLLEAYKSSLPPVVWEDGGGQAFAGEAGERGGIAKESAKKSMYGFKPRTVTLALKACAKVNEAAGALASSLESKKCNKNGRARSFLKEHGESEDCWASTALERCFPEDCKKTARSSMPPRGVKEWIAWGRSQSGSKLDG